MSTTMAVLPKFSDKGVGDLALWPSPGWNLLAEELSLPVAVLDVKKLQQNLLWMQQFANKAGVQLAPHGKTGMMPDLFLAQIAQGAWGITLATVPQVAAAFGAGVRRVLLANPLVGKRQLQLVAEMMHQGLEFYCLVDNSANVRQLAEFYAAQQLQLNVLLEIGVPGGRSGLRSLAEAKSLARQIATLPALQLRGVEFYEGVMKGPDQSQQIRNIRHFVDQCIAFTLACRADGLFAPGDIVFSGAGSAWYDLVAEQIGAAGLAQTDAVAAVKIAQRQQQGSSPQCQKIVPLLRPGCYLFFDLGIYQQAQQQLLARSALACGVTGELQNALEIWAYVLSLPEPGLAVIGMGKRDIAFDAGFALVQQYYRPGTAAPVAADRRFVIEKMMDQHALLKIPADAELAVGDMLSFAGSHPCLTLDKWRYLAVLDSDYQVRQLYPTFF